MDRPIVHQRDSEIIKEQINTASRRKRSWTRNAELFDRRIELWMRDPTLTMPPSKKNNNVESPSAIIEINSPKNDLPWDLEWPEPESEVGTIEDAPQMCLTCHVNEVYDELLVHCWPCENQIQKSLRHQEWKKKNKIHPLSTYRRRPAFPVKPKPPPNPFLIELKFLEQNFKEKTMQIAVINAKILDENKRHCQQMKTIQKDHDERMIMLQNQYKELTAIIRELEKGSRKQKTDFMKPFSFFPNS